MTNAVLSFDRVGFTSSVQDVADLQDVSFSLTPGAVLLVKARGAERLPIPELATGMADVDEGIVNFQGLAWDDRGATDAAEARGRIGRVFAGTGWVSNLTVYENVVLCTRNYGRGLSDDDIHQEAVRLAARVGLEGISDARPGTVLADPLQRSAWVRAFLGQRDLVLLEYPEAWVDPLYVPRLTDLVCEACGRGTAVLWITREEATWASHDLAAACKMEYENGSVIEATDSAGESKG